MKKALMFCYGILGGMFFIACFGVWAICLAAWVLVFRTDPPLPSVLSSAALSAIVLPIIVEILGRKLTTKTDAGTIVAVNDRKEVVEFGMCLWKKPGLTHVLLPTYLSETERFRITTRFGSFIINTIISITVEGKGGEKDLNYFNRLHLIWANDSVKGTSLSDHFVEKIKRSSEENAEKISEILSDYVSRSGNCRGDVCGDTHKKIIECLIVGNPFIDLADVKISVESIEVERTLPPLL